eukprot:11920923-Alexandrium_andersonii.AAC.1
MCIRDRVELAALAALEGVPEEATQRLWKPLAIFLDNRPAGRRRRFSSQRGKQGRGHRRLAPRDGR